jgi:hypothetical protein
LNIIKQECERCGAPIIISGNETLINCKYCGYLLETTARLTSRNSSCDCGRALIAYCVDCQKPLCDLHALYISQFDLESLLSANGSFSKPELNLLISGFVKEVGSNNIFCAPCLDVRIEKWLQNANSNRR